MANQIEPVRACERLLDALGKRAPDISPRALSETLTGWEFLDCGGAVVMRRDNELHVAAPANRRGRWINRRDLREVLGSVLTCFGSARTGVALDNAAGHAFVRRLGFRETARDGVQVRYEMEELHA